MNSIKYKQLADLVKHKSPLTRHRQICEDTRNFINSYAIQGIMCRSTNGTLLAGVQLATGRRVVIKVISKQTESQLINGRPVPLEIAMHQRVNGASEHIIELLDWYERRNDFVIILDFSPRHLNLVEYVAIFGPLSVTASLAVAKQLAQAADAMFRYGVCHRDLKHENVLIDHKTLKVKIIDFGCATYVCTRRQRLNSFRGTVEFTPPEFFAYGQCQAEKATVYSIGLITYFISCSSIDQLTKSLSKQTTESCSKAPGAELKKLGRGKDNLLRLIKSCINSEEERVDLKLQFYRIALFNVRRSQTILNASED